MCWDSTAPFPEPPGNMYLDSVQIELITPQAIPTGSPSTPITFDTVIFDPLAAWNSATPSALTIPAGVGHIRIVWHAYYANQTAAGAQQSVGTFYIFHNGTNMTPGIGGNGVIQPGTNNGAPHALTTNGASQLLPTTPGDVYTMRCDHFTGQPLSLQSAVFGIEFYD